MNIDSSLKDRLYLQTSQNRQYVGSDQITFILRYRKVQGDFLQPPHGSPKLLIKSQGTISLWNYFSTGHD